MAASTPRSTPGGSRRPSKSGGVGARASARRRTPPSQAAKPVAADLLSAPRFGVAGTSKFTGRAAILVVVLALLSLSYASSMKAYLVQRSHIRELQTEIAAHEANIKVLERQTARWDDPEYVKAQARERFGYVMPGEVSLVVIDADGNPIDPAAELSNPSGLAEDPVAWWGKAWASMETAGNPPTLEQPAPETIPKPADR